MPVTYYNKGKRRIGFGWILLLILLVLAVIAYFTVPSEEKMKASVEKYVKMELKSKTANKEPTDKDVKETFYEFNTVEYEKFPLWRAGWLHNRYKTSDRLGCLGIFGITIPTVDFYDYIYPLGPAKHKYPRAGKSNPEETPIMGNNDYDTGVLPDED